MITATTRTRPRRPAPIRTTLYVPTGADPTPSLTQLRGVLRSGDTLAFDVETNALDYGDPAARVRTIQVGTSSVALLLDAATPSHVEAARDLLNDPAYRLTAHNAGYDILWLCGLGVFDSPAQAWSRCDDTFIWATQLMPPERDRARYRDLKTQAAAWCPEAVSADAKTALAAVFTRHRWSGMAASWSAYPRGVEAADPDADPLTRNGWAQVARDDPQFVQYQAADVYDGHALHQALGPIVTSLWPERSAVEHRAARLATEMSHRGMRLDRAWTRERLDEALAKRFAAAATLADLGVEAPGDNAQLVAALQRAGVELRRTDKGQAATDKESLARYREVSEVAAQLCDATAAFRDGAFRAGYAARFLRHGGDRIHAQISTMTARTGRMSVSNPSLQNAPRKGGIRECLIADDGMALISADFSSIEMRVGAGLTGDAVLSALYTTPLAPGEDKKDRDPYWIVARALYGPDATQEQRDDVKSVVLGRMYGGGAATLADQVNLPVARVQEILRTMDRTYPVLKSWSRDHIEPHIAAGLPGWTLDSGRWQTLDPSRSYAGLNMLIQGTARDLLIDAMFRVEDAGFGPGLLLPIHDELLVQVPVAEAEGAAERLAAAMRTTYRGIPIIADAKILGPRWTKA